MRLPAISSVLFIFFILIYHTYGKYDLNVYFNDELIIPYNTEGIKIIPTKHTAIWTALYYCGLFLYISLMNFSMYLNSVIIYRTIFIISSVLISIYFLTEALCFIYPNNYTELVTDINMYIVFIIFLITFGILTYKSIKQ